MNKLLIGLFISALGLSNLASAQTPAPGSATKQGAPALSSDHKKSGKSHTGATHKGDRNSRPAGTNLTGDQSLTKQVTNGENPTSPAEKSLGLGNTGGKLGGIGSK